MMTRKEAYKIAEKYIKQYNPNMWDGNGDIDDKFSSEIKTYDISSNIYMTIQFEIDRDENSEWAHEVKLYIKEDDEMIDGYFGYGVNSIENMTDTIMDICKEYNEMR